MVLKESVANLINNIPKFRFYIKFCYLKQNNALKIFRPAKLTKLNAYSCKFKLNVKHSFVLELELELR